MNVLLERINARQEKIHDWLQRREHSEEIPLYTSVDIRNGGFKFAVVDTNLFPAGFNNLCEHGVEDAVKAIRSAILSRRSDCRKILILAEEHTRNVWYLENVRILQEIIATAGFEAIVATFLNVQPAICSDANFVELETATGHSLRVYSVRRVVHDVEAGSMKPDMIILNNDLSTGIPDELKAADTPIYPSIQAGWHARLKSHHFCHTADLMAEFATLIDFDPWLLTALYGTVDEVDINDPTGRERLQDEASDLFVRIGEKYREHGIDEKPFIFLKADAGTYGMGVLPCEDASEIGRLNRRDRNRLYRGKSGKMITRYLLQEGIPTIHTVDEMVGEACIYQIANELVGGFYRVHGAKDERTNLNAKGMTFEAMCPHSSRYGDCGVHTENNVFDIYRILARIAGVAAHREIIQLEAAVS